MLQQAVTMLAVGPEGKNGVDFGEKPGPFRFGKNLANSRVLGQGVDGVRMKSVNVGVKKKLVKSGVNRGVGSGQARKLADGIKEVITGEIGRGETIELGDGTLGQFCYFLGKICTRKD